MIMDDLKVEYGWYLQLFWDIDSIRYFSYKYCKIIDQGEAEEYVILRDEKNTLMILSC